MKKLKIAFSLLLITIMLAAAAVSYAFWDNLRFVDDTQNPIGKGTTLNVTLQSGLPAGKTLIPPDAVVGVDDVTSVVLTYLVNLDKTPANPLTLAVSYENILIGGVDTYADLVVISISELGTVTQVEQTVTVTVSLVGQDQITQAAYQAINSKDITFDLIFNAS